MVTAYPVAFKKKSQEICLAFTRGCGGQLGTTLRDGAAAFYGVDDSNVEIWREVLRTGRDYFYIDNSYFDSARQLRFRVTKNALQHTGDGESDGKRFAALGIEVKPWQPAGEHIVVCPQSTPFMKTIAEYEGDWLDDAKAWLNARTKRPLRIRQWSADKGKLSRSLGDDLRGAHALVTWSSAAGVTALLSGIPVISNGPGCFASRSGWMFNDSENDVENLPRPPRETWAGVLADNEFTLDEMKRGMAWEKLNR